jgi:hypothetical protein
MLTIAPPGRSLGVIVNQPQQILLPIHELERLPDQSAFRDNARLLNKGDDVGRRDPA